MHSYRFQKQKKGSTLDLKAELKKAQSGPKMLSRPTYIKSHEVQLISSNSIEIRTFLGV